VRVHDLKHTFGRRLSAAGVGEETRKILLGHTNGDITTHYSAVGLAKLINAVNKIDRSLATPAITLLRAAA
jgi:integrase